MRRNPAITVGMLVAVAIATVWCFSVMISRRFAGGEVYPPCSTQRTDPLGAKVLYEAIDRLAETSCERNFKRLAKLSDVSGSGESLIAASRHGQTLVILDAERFDFDDGDSLDGDALRDFAAAGGRVVITVNGDEDASQTVEEASEERLQELREKRRERARKEKEQAKKKESADKDKGSKSKSNPQDKPEKDGVQEHGPEDKKKPEPETMPMRAAKSLIEALHIDVKSKGLKPIPEGGHALETPSGVAAPWGTLPRWFSRLSLDLAPKKDEDKDKEDEARDKENEDKDKDDAKEKGDAKPNDTKSGSAAKEPWRVLATVEGNPVLAERRLGQGSVVIATDSYFAMNQALMMHPVPEFLAWLIGDARHVIFDETHLGTQENPGIMTMARRYRLHGFFVGGVLLFALFVWQSSGSLVPSADGSESGPRTVAGQGAVAGLVSLLRRGISRSRLLQTCFDQWVRNHPHPGAALRARIEMARAMLPEDANRPPRGALIAMYQRLCETLHPNRH